MRGRQATACFLASRLGSEERVLVEEPGRGHGESFAEVRFAGGQAGEIARVAIEGQRDGRLIGRRLS